VVADDLLSLSGAWNFRDVAEAISADGQGIQPRRFFRSSELSGLDEDGRDVLRRLGITDIADLRSPGEVERRGPGRVPDGMVVHPLPFPDEKAAGESPDQRSWHRVLTERPDGMSVAVAAQRYMTEEYQRFPTLPGSQRAVRRVITLLGDGRPVITHCFAGKDRTGFTVAVVLEALGVPRDSILADYLRSNDAMPQLRSRIVQMIRERAGAFLDATGFAEDRLTDEVLGVREDYLAAARSSIDDNFGSLTGYLDAAGVTHHELAALRDALVG
jgi:protein-tyrosine phosphatase